MHTEIGTYATPNASKYLQQLCKHFAHKVEAEFTPTEGTVAFPMGSARLTATETLLTIRFDLGSADDAEKAHSVIDRHLEKFAFREEFKHMDWQTLA